MNLIKYFTIPICILFVACSSVKNIVQTYDYDDQELTASVLAIAPFIPDIKNRDDFNDERRKGTPEDLFMERFKFTFSKEVLNIARIDNIHFSKTNIDSLLIKKNFSVDRKTKITVKLPEKGFIVPFDTIKADFILFLDGFKTEFIKDTIFSSTDWIVGATGMAQMPITNKIHKEGIKISTDFVLWDNKIGKKLSFGKADYFSETMYTVSFNNWDQCIGSIAYQIFNNSPFYKKKD